MFRCLEMHLHVCILNKVKTLTAGELFLHHQNSINPQREAQHTPNLRAPAGASTATPKPRVESSSLSAPATKTPEIARFQAFFSLFQAKRGLGKSSQRGFEHLMITYRETLPAKVDEPGNRSDIPEKRLKSAGSHIIMVKSDGFLLSPTAFRSEEMRKTSRRDGGQSF